MQDNSQVVIKFASANSKMVLNCWQLLVDSEFRLIKLSLENLRTGNDLVGKQKAVPASFSDSGLTETGRAMTQNYLDCLGRCLCELLELQAALGQETRNAVSNVLASKE